MSWRDRSRSRDGEEERLTPEEEAAARILTTLKNDPEVQAAFEDGEAAAEGRDGGGKRKRRGGAGKGGRAIADAVAAGEGRSMSEKNKPEAVVKAELKEAAASGETTQVAEVVAANPGTIRRIVESAMKARAAAQPAMIVIGAATIANKPTFFGNIARVAAASIRTGLDTTITSTWSEWGQTGTDILGAVKSVGEAVFQQTLQGPVVPFTIAMMLQAYRASSRGMGILELTKSDAATAAEIVRTAIKGQKEAFDAAYKAESQKKPIAQLREIARRGRPLTRDETSMAARSSAAPAVGSMGVVPGFTPPGPPGAPIMNLAAVPSSAVAAATAARKDAREEGDAAEALVGLANAPAAMDTSPNGGRRRRRTKRRVPKRKRATRKLLTFVY